MTIDFMTVKIMRGNVLSYVTLQCSGSDTGQELAQEKIIVFQATIANTKVLTAGIKDLGVLGFRVDRI